MKAIGNMFTVSRTQARRALSAVMAAACMVAPTYAQSTEIPAPPQRTQVVLRNVAVHTAVPAGIGSAPRSRTRT
ncbi:MAG: hypothetical protein ACKOTD_07395 [Phycisphaerales bacterium]